MKNIIVIISILLLTGCAASDLTSPCASFGSSCTKTAVNNWAQ